MADGVADSAGWRLPRFSREMQNYLGCLMLHMLLPLTPLIFESASTGWNPPSTQTLALTAAMYSMAIGLTSRSIGIFCLCLVMGVVFSGLFGIAVKNPTPAIAYSSAGAICLVFVVHAIERYTRHVIDCMPFFEFMGGGQ